MGTVLLSYNFSVDLVGFRSAGSTNTLQVQSFDIFL